MCINNNVSEVCSDLRQVLTSYPHVANSMLQHLSVDTLLENTDLTLKYTSESDLCFISYLFVLQ